jgi:hypothetical protein
MPNALTSLSPKFWSAIMGRKVFKSTVYKSLGSSEEKSTLKIGNQVTRPHRADLFVEDYIKGTSASEQDLTTTEDLLNIDKQKTILMYVDDVDKINNVSCINLVNCWELS